VDDDVDARERALQSLSTDPAIVSASSNPAPA
jgi:hypothetical protein